MRLCLEQEPVVWVGKLYNNKRERLGTSLGLFETGVTLSSSVKRSPRHLHKPDDGN